MAKHNVLTEQEAHELMINRFYNNFVVGNPAACWNYTGFIQPKNKEQYGFLVKVFNKKRKQIKAHRLAYCLYHNIDIYNLQKEQVIMHTCDNPSCVNPHHLILGTIQLNNQDKVKKKRHNTTGINKPQHGELNKRVVLTEEQVRYIKTFELTHKNCVALGEEFGVNHQTIRFILNGTNWSHIQ